ERLETARFIKRHGITCFRQNLFFPVNTLTIMRGAIAAQKLGVFERYVDEIYRHRWSEPKKLDDPAGLRAALRECGFDRERFAELVQDAAVKALPAREHGTFSGARYVRVTHLLCRRRDLFRQRPAARCRGNDTGDALMFTLRQMTHPIVGGRACTRPSTSRGVPLAGFRGCPAQGRARTKDRTNHI